MRKKDKPRYVLKKWGKKAWRIRDVEFNVWASSPKGYLDKGNGQAQTDRLNYLDRKAKAKKEQEGK